MTNNLSDAKRLQIVLDHLHLSGNRLSKILKYKSAASIYHVLEERNSLSPKMIEGIIQKFPSVSYKFLKSGKGEPIISNVQEQKAQKDLFTTLLGEETSTTLPSRTSNTYGKSEQLEILIENSRKTNVLLNALLEEIQHLNKKL
jgi:hypothetical protein